MKKWILLFLLFCGGCANRRSYVTESGVCGVIYHVNPYEPDKGEVEVRAQIEFQRSSYRQNLQVQIKQKRRMRWEWVLFRAMVG